MKEHENPKERAITDLHVPTGSWDIEAQSQEFGHTSSPQGSRHFLDFRSRSRLKEVKYDVITAPPKIMKQLKM